MTSEQKTQVVVEDVHSSIQAQIEQIHADAQRRDEEAKRQVGNIAAELLTLTEQLNKFKPASVTEVSGGQQRLSEEFEQRL